MKRLIDADVLEKKIYDWSKATGCEYYTKYHFFGFIEHTPDVDAVEVVRCKDCKHCMLWREPSEKAIGDCRFRVMYSTDEQFQMVGEDDFCSYGERKDNGTVDC